MFKRLALIVLFCCLMAVPVIAQDATPEAAPSTVTVVTAPSAAADPSLVYILGTVLILGILATITIAGPKIVEVAANGAPPWAIEAVVSAVNRLMEYGQAYTESTPSKYDDEALDALKAKLLALEDQLRQKETSPAVVNNINPPPDSTSNSG